MFRVIGPQPAVSRLCLQPQRLTEIGIRRFSWTPKEAESSPSSISRQTARPTDQTAAREHRGNRLRGRSRRFRRGNVSNPGALWTAHEHTINEVVLRVPSISEPPRREHDASMRPSAQPCSYAGEPCPFRARSGGGPRGTTVTHGEEEQGETPSVECLDQGHFGAALSSALPSLGLSLSAAVSRTCGNAVSAACSNAFSSRARGLPGFESESRRRTTR